MNSSRLMLFALLTLLVLLSACQQTVKAPPQVSTVSYFESISLDAVSGQAWTKASLSNRYDNMVVVCTVHRLNNDLPELVRVRNAAGSSFEVRLQNPSGSTLKAERVYCLVAEEGVWKLPDGLKFEARRFTSKVTNYFTQDADGAGAWSGNGTRVNYGQTYTSPVILGQVMTFNDPKWSVFWSQGEPKDTKDGARPPASATALYIGKHVGEDSNTSRADETLGYMVFEASNASKLDGIAYEVQLGPDAIYGKGNEFPGGTNRFRTSFAAAPAFAVVTHTGMDGFDGAWAVLDGETAIVRDALQLIMQEDQLKDVEQWHLSEQVGYFVAEKELNLMLERP
ncbi:MAG: hypothetical protein KC422_04675 [Trueperaceae bacterium]|nr:hypothetical protein [Trueperaceae bacterium]